MNVNIVFLKDGDSITDPKWVDILADVSAEANEIREKISNAYGPFQDGYKLRINFNSENRIQTCVNVVLKEITIDLPEYELNQDDNARYQRSLNLSHELVHTLIPHRDPAKVTVLEEGLATHFAETYTRVSSCPNADYANARDLVSQLLKIDKDIVKTIREKHPTKSLYEFTVLDLLAELCPQENALVQSLTSPFYLKT